MTRRRIAFVASDTDEARQARDVLSQRYDAVPPEGADVIVALGGDGFMLATLHQYMQAGTLIYGMNRGTVGFLMNRYNEEDLHARLDAAEEVIVRPLVMEAKQADGSVRTAYAFNEVSLFRQTYQTAHLRIRVDHTMRLECLMCDGCLVATPAGSTAYNLSAHGPIVPLGAGLLCLTPISAFRPRRWRGALLPHTAAVHFVVLDHEKRPVSATADACEVRDVVAVTVREDDERAFTLLFDPGHSLEERILHEQFAL